MKFYNVKVGDKISWVTQGTIWEHGKPQKRLLKYPAEVLEVFETTFTCKTTDAYYLYRCNKSDGIAIGSGLECGWAERGEICSSKTLNSSAKAKVTKKSFTQHSVSRRIKSCV